MGLMDLDNRERCKEHNGRTHPWGEGEWDEGSGLDIQHFGRACEMDELR